MPKKIGDNQPFRVSCNSNRVRKEIRISCTLSSGVSKPVVMDFLEDLEKNYLDLSTGHIKFDVKTNDRKLRKGAKVANAETAGGQHVEHDYEITKMNHENGEFSMFSPNSQVTGTFGCFPYRAQVETKVDFKVLEQVGGGTKVDAQLILTFPNKRGAFVANTIGTGSTWRKHFEEELTNASKIMTRS